MIAALPTFDPCSTLLRGLLTLLAGLALLLPCPDPVDAAELRTSIGRVVLEGGVAYVEFEVSWRLSWRNEVNRDAAWVFVKLHRRPEDLHMPLAASSHRMTVNHRPGEPDAAIRVPEDGRGAFVYRDERRPGRGPNHWTVRLRLALPEGVAANDLPPRLDVHAVEMVHIPQGPFEVGDPRPRADSPSNAFFRVTPDSTAAPPFRVTGPGTIALCGEVGFLCHTEDDVWSDEARPDSVPAAFPSGFEPFWMMKYEVTQGQIVDFVNSLSGGQTASRDPIRGEGYEARRGAITRVGSTYVTSRPDRAATHLTWADGAAYADWAGLRPMTEFEFTKAARGPRPAVAGEFAWGSTWVRRGDTIRGPDGDRAVREDRSEWMRGNADIRVSEVYEPFVGGDGGAGPLRVDIFETRAWARGASDLREASGAGYYGVIGLSGSQWERMVSATSARGLAFTGEHGDGDLAYPAEANVPGWPDMTARGLGVRGGIGSSGPYRSVVAARMFGDYAAHYPGARMGFRAVRSASLP